MDRKVVMIKIQDRSIVRVFNVLFQKLATLVYDYTEKAKKDFLKICFFFGPRYIFACYLPTDCQSKNDICERMEEKKAYGKIFTCNKGISPWDPGPRQ